MAQNEQIVSSIVFPYNVIATDNSYDTVTMVSNEDYHYSVDEIQNWGLDNNDDTGDKKNGNNDDNNNNTNTNGLHIAKYNNPIPTPSHLITKSTSTTTTTYTPRTLSKPISTLYDATQLNLLLHTRQLISMDRLTQLQLEEIHATNEFSGQVQLSPYNLMSIAARQNRDVMIEKQLQQERMRNAANKAKEMEKKKIQKNFAQALTKGLTAAAGGATGNATSKKKKTAVAGKKTVGQQQQQQPLSSEQPKQQETEQQETEQPETEQPETETKSINNFSSLTEIDTDGAQEEEVE